jgi:hypothetical protein
MSASSGFYPSWVPAFAGTTAKMAVMAQRKKPGPHIGGPGFLKAEPEDD